MKRPSHSHRSALIATVLLLVVAAAANGVESSCMESLQAAGLSYDDGRFEPALEQVAACLAAKPTRGEKTLALALRAKTLLAIDEVDAARRAVEELLRSNLAFKPNEVSDPPRFVQLVAEVKQETTTVRISSVSKTGESLREAPATVTVLTAEEIARRGYLDLEALLHDLAGFDISRTNGATYSNIYQRGYRSDLTTRTQVLIDGVVENDIWTQAAYLSRQYPLVNVERVEIIYGPASTMYGANAFAGVINIVTKDPGKVLAEGKRFGVKAEVAGGTWNTRYVDVMAMGRSRDGDVSWSLTSRVYRSDEMDLSGYDDWDWDPAVYDNFDYAQNMNLVGTEAQQYLAQLEEQRLECLALPPSDQPESGCPEEFSETHPYYTIEREAGVATAIKLTTAGIDRASELDRELLGQEFDGLTAGYEDVTDSWLLHGKLQAPNLVLGFQTWKKKEGWDSWRTDQVSFGKRIWVPKQTWYYLRYSKPISENLFLTLFSRYREHELEGDTRSIEIEKNFANGTLGIADLATENPNKNPGSLRNRYWYLLNSQFVNELKLVYTSPDDRFNLVGGIEHRSSSVQGNYVFSREPNPSETGPETAFVGSNRFSVTDTGLYAQASYKPREHLKLVAGGRLDDNKVRDSGGYGSAFNPRLAVIYTPGDFSFKAIYSQAFQDASNFQKYQSSSNGSAVPNPTLAPEEVDNFELSAGWQPTEHLSLDAVGYEARYDGRIALLTVADCSGLPDIYGCNAGESGQFQNFGSLKIRGLQVDGKLKYDKFSIFEDFVIFGNYTYTDPINEVFKDADEVDQFNQRIADIATHQFNLGINASWREKLNANLRVNYVGARKTGEGTDLPSNTLEGGQVDSYVVAHASLSWEDLLPHTSLRLTVNNLFDTEYCHPGIRGADG
ncbi:MAG: TonB-dependent receptor, partial [bacterium]|nr:TonB-dependent receptor [bacterium]